LPSAISFPLPGGFGTLTRKKRAPLGAPRKKRESAIYAGSRGFSVIPSQERHQYLAKLIFFCSYMLLWFYAYSSNFLLFITFCNQSATGN